MDAEPIQYKIVQSSITDELEPAFNDLGAKGWLLVQILRPSPTSMFVFFFMRPGS